MLYNFCFLLSVAVIIITFIITAVLKSRKPEPNLDYKNANVNVIFVLGVGIFISTFIAYIPLFFTDLNGNVFRTILLSFHNAIKTFLGDLKIEFITFYVNKSVTDLYISYQTFLIIIGVLSPLFTFGAIFAYLINASTKIIYALSFNRHRFVFSTLNQKSLSLAESLEANYKKLLDDYKNKKGEYENKPHKKKPLKPLIFFCGCNAVTDEGLLREAKNLRAVIIKQDILTFNFTTNSPYLTFFVINEDEEYNVTVTLKLISFYKDLCKKHTENANRKPRAEFEKRKNEALKNGEEFTEEYIPVKTKRPRLYYFSHDIEGALVLHANKHHNLKVTKINEPFTLVNKLLLDNYQDLFVKGTTLQPNGNKKISAVIVGLGSYGREMLKSLTCACQMPGYELEINAFDKNPNASALFEKECPELISEEFYNIKIHSGMNADSVEFIKKLQEVKDASYAFISLGDDEENIRTCVDLRIIFERMGVNPVITTIVYNPEFNKSLNEYQEYIHKENLQLDANHFKNCYDITFIGDLKTLYSIEFIDTKWKRLAFINHEKWGKGGKEFWASEYEFKKSTHRVIHGQIMHKLKLFKVEEDACAIQNPTCDYLDGTDFLLWNAILRSMGYTRIETGEKSHIGKMHPCLIQSKQLYDLKEKLDNVYKK